MQRTQMQPKFGHKNKHKYKQNYSHKYREPRTCCYVECKHLTSALATCSWALPSGWKWNFRGKKIHYMLKTRIRVIFRGRPPKLNKIFVLDKETINVLGGHSSKMKSKFSKRYFQRGAEVEMDGTGAPGSKLNILDFFSHIYLARVAKLMTKSFWPLCISLACNRK